MGQSLNLRKKRSMPLNQGAERPQPAREPIEAATLLLTTVSTTYAAS
jgi:hypothetical protein